MTILCNGVLFTLNDRAYGQFLVHIIEGTMPEGWLLQNSKSTVIADIDLESFGPEEAKEKLREILFENPI